MNLLINDPPTELCVDDVIYPIDADYRNCLVALSAFDDANLSNREQWSIALYRLFADVPGYPESKVPQDIEKAAERAAWFLNCGEEMKPAKEGKLYSFSHDDKLIRSAIEKSRSIRLKDAGFIHWWEFVYYFFDLDENCFFSRVMGIRYRRSTGKLTKEDREFIRRNPDIINIPDPTSSEEQQEYNDARDELLARLGGGQPDG
jgi:hypothetical protein